MNIQNLSPTRIHKLIMILPKPALIAFFLLTICHLCLGDEDQALSSKPTVSNIKIDGDDVQLVIATYAHFSGYNLIEASNAKRLSVPIWFNSEPGHNYLPTDAAQLLQKVLLDQAGIIITPLDNKTASVTYNDKLAKQKVKKSRLNSDTSKQ